MAHFFEYDDPDSYWADLRMRFRGWQSDREGFRLAASGGSSAQLFDHLRAEDFTRTDVWQVDERCVPFNHPDNNANALQKKISPSLRKFHRFDTTKSPEISAEIFANTLQKDVNGNYFNLTVLGVGSDGHTASLFPDTPLSCKLAMHTTTNEFAVSDRVTLTFEALRRSERVVVIVMGAAKADLWKKITAGGAGLPIGHLVAWPQTEFWYLRNV